MSVSAASAPRRDCASISASEREASARACIVTQLRKTRMCVRFLQGNGCPSELDCMFAHSFEELETKPDLRKTRLCKAYSKGRCSYGACTFAHGEQELRFTDTFYKKTLCTFHLKGTCRNGEQCRFAHGEDDLRLSDGDLSPPLSEPDVPTQEGSELSTIGSCADGEHADGTPEKASSCSSSRVCAAGVGAPSANQLEGPTFEWPDTDSDSEECRSSRHFAPVDAARPPDMSPAGIVSPRTPIALATMPPAMAASNLVTVPQPTNPVHQMQVPTGAPPMSIPALSATAGVALPSAPPKCTETLLQSLAVVSNPEPVVSSVLANVLSEAMDELRWQRQTHGRTQVRVDASFDSLLERIRHDVFLLSAKCSQVQRTMHCQTGLTDTSGDWRRDSAHSGQRMQQHAVHDLPSTLPLPHHYLPASSDVNCVPPYVEDATRSWIHIGQRDGSFAATVLAPHLEERGGQQTQHQRSAGRRRLGGRR